MASELRTRFRNFMTLRRFSPKTKEAYIRAVADLARYHGKSPDLLDNEEIQAYLRHLIEDRRLAWSSCNVAFSGIRSFYLNVLQRSETAFHIPPRPRIRKIPVILSRREVLRIIEAASNIKHGALLKTVYGGGLRVSEAVRLKPEHIESDRMMIRVEQGKGQKDRYTILGEAVLEILRTYWKAC